MSTTLLAVCGVVAGALNLLALIPYMRDIFRKKTKPERATWWIWLILNMVAAAALIDSGARWQIGMNIGQTLAVGAIALLSLKYGYGKFHKKDLISLIIAAVGVVLWRFTHQPVLALLIVVGVDIAGLWLTIAKTWQSPFSETLSMWALTALAAALGVVAVGEWSFTKMLYPVYVAVANIVLVALIKYRRPIVKKLKVKKR